MSRLEFDDQYKKYVFNIFSELFTGLKIAHKSQFIPGWRFVTNWKLDLGAGDVLKQSILIEFNRYNVSPERLRFAKIAHDQQQEEKEGQNQRAEEQREPECKPP